MNNEDKPIAVYDTDVAKVLGIVDGVTDEELLGRIIEIEDGRVDGALLGRIVLKMEDGATDGALLDRVVGNIRGAVLGLNNGAVD